MQWVKQHLGEIVNVSGQNPAPDLRMEREDGQCRSGDGVVSLWMIGGQMKGEE